MGKIRIRNTVFLGLGVLQIQIRNEQPRSYFRELETIFWVKILKFFDADPGWKNSNLGSCMEKIRIRDKHPGSATLQINIF
jgi:hypothetical protein